MAGAVEDIVSTEWLSKNLDKTDVVVLDVTWYSAKSAREDYEKCHISGAPHFDIFKGVNNTDLHPRNLPEPSVFEQNAQDVGVNNNSHVIVYDSEGRHGFFLGSRAWFMFKHFGLARVSVLNGGLQKWLKDGHPTSGEIEKPTKGNFKANLNAQILKRVDFMRQNREDKSTQVLDSRAPGGNTGKPEDKNHATYGNGHYPGAINIPFKANLLDTAAGTFKSPEDLQKLFTEFGVAMDKPVVTMCNSGMSSCSLLLAATIAGIKDASIYQAGFTEWRSQASDTDIEKVYS